MTRLIQSAGMTLLLTTGLGVAGPYSPAAGQAGSTAVHASSPRFGAWASRYTNYVVGVECDEVFQTPPRALGPATADVFDIVTLGRGGQITLGFEHPIVNGPGDDFAVFENAVTDTFLELAYVEVSSDGEYFVRFHSDSLTPGSIGPFFDPIDPTDIDGLAGTFAVSYGTPFDLADLPSEPGFDPNRVTWVRIVDVNGDGTALDTDGDPIYDPYPCVQSAGFDLEAVGVIHQSVNLSAPHLQADEMGTEVSFSSGLHRRYQVEFTPDLTSTGAWTPVGEDIAGNGLVLTVTHSNPPPRGIYRVREWMEESP